MNEEQIQKLEELRGVIINEVAPLGSDSEDLPPAQRVELLMISAETAEDPVPLITKAHQIAQSIEDVRERAAVLMDLLGSIETLLVEPEDEGLEEGDINDEANDELDNDSDNNQNEALNTQAATIEQPATQSAEQSIQDTTDQAASAENQPGVDQG